MIEFLGLKATIFCLEICQNEIAFALAGLSNREQNIYFHFLQPSLLTLVDTLFHFKNLAKSFSRKSGPNYVQIPVLK